MPTLLSMEALEADRRFVEHQLAEADDNPWATARHMWHTRLAEIEAQIAALSASISNYATVALIFDGTPVIGSGDIRLDFTTDALQSYQRLISLALAARLSDGDLPERGRLPGADRSRLYIRDLVRGSMGFILEEVTPEQQEILPSLLKQTVETTTQLLTTLSEASDEEFETTLKNTQGRLISAIQKFASVLHEAGASTRILGDERKLALSTQAVGLLSRRLSDVEVVEEAVTIDGILLGVLPDSREFELKPFGEASTIKGSVADDLVQRYTADFGFRDQFLLQSVRATIKVIKTMRNTKVLREKRVLEELERASPLLSSQSSLSTRSDSI
jgi:hypothetical protein